MKSCLAMVLSLFILSGCGKGSSGSSNSSASTFSGSKQVKTVPEVEDFLAEMNEYRVVYLNSTAIDNVIFEYTATTAGPMEAPARGYCDKSGFTPRIVLYQPDWTGPFASDMNMKKASFYHLVGHCIYNKAHNDALSYSSMDGSVTNAKSFMHSNFGYHLFPNGALTSLRMVDLQREFFNYYGPL